MRTIQVVIPAAILFGAAGTVRAQGEQPAMVGMPENSIGLSGTPEGPVIENHSGRVIYWLQH